MYKMVVDGLDDERDEAVIDPPIGGGSVIYPGTYMCTLSRAEATDPEGNNLRISWENSFGDRHSERMFIVNTYRNFGLTRESKLLLSSVLRDLDVLKFARDMGYSKFIQSFMVGIQCVITIGKESEGYHISREGDLWFAEENGQRVTEYHSHVTAVHRECKEKGISRGWFIVTTYEDQGGRALSAIRKGIKDYVKRQEEVYQSQENADTAPQSQPTDIRSRSSQT